MKRKIQPIHGLREKRWKKVYIILPIEWNNQRRSTLLNTQNSLNRQEKNQRRMFLSSLI